MNDHDHVIFLGDTNSRLHWPDKVGGMPLRQAARLGGHQDHGHQDHHDLSESGQGGWKTSGGGGGNIP